MLGQIMCLRVAIYSIPFNLIYSMTKCLKFDPTPGIEGVCKDRIFACMVPFYFDLQNDYFQKKMTFDPKDRTCTCESI